MIFNDLALFVSVAEAMSFSKAAENLSIPASRVSRRLADLELQLGYKLFERTTRNVRLTEEGRLLLDRCQMPVEALRNLGGTSETSSISVINITAPPLAARTSVGERILDFIEENPSIRINLNSTNLNLDFIRDNIDLAFRLGPVKEDLLVAKPLWNVPYTFCVGDKFFKHHELKKRIERKDLLALPALMFGSFWPVEEGERLKPVNVAHVFDELELLMQAVQRNMGVALLPTEMLGNDLKKLNVAGTQPTQRVMNAVYPTRRLLPARVRKLIDFMAYNQ